MFFCGKTQDQVKKLIAGPEVYICDECVELCNEILDEEFLETKDKKEDTAEAAKQEDLKDIPKPHEIKAYLDQYIIGQDDAKKCFLLLFITIINGLLIMLFQIARMMWKFTKVIFCWLVLQEAVKLY